jgi:hypothetical protein
MGQTPVIFVQYSDGEALDHLDQISALGSPQRVLLRPRLETRRGIMWQVADRD